MSMSVLNTFCRVFNYIFVEDGQDNGQAVFCFIDFKNRRARFTAEEISRRVAVGVGFRGAPARNGRREITSGGLRPPAGPRLVISPLSPC